METLFQPVSKSFVFAVIATELTVILAVALYVIAH